MKIQKASDVLQPYVRRNISTALGGGASVSVPAITDEECVELAPSLGGASFAERVKTSPGAVPVVKLDPTTQQTLSATTQHWTLEQRTAIGVGSGVAVGVGVGLLLDQLRLVAPKSSLVLALACGLAGGGVGAAVVNNLVEIEIERDPKGAIGLKLHGVKV